MTWDKKSDNLNGVASGGGRNLKVTRHKAATLCRRRQNRGADGVRFEEGVSPFLVGEESGEGAVPPRPLPRKFFDLDLKTASFIAF